MFAVSLDNLLFLLLIAVAALFQLLSKAISKSGKSGSDETSSSSDPETPRPFQRTPRESDADRIRKFLEALGQPPSSSPPPPVLPRTDIPPRRLAPVQPPPVSPGMWRVPRKRQQKPDVIQGETTSPARQIVPPSVPAPAAMAFEVHETLAVQTPEPPTVNTPEEAYAQATRPAARTRRVKTDVVTLLASKSSLRDAILLREILGPPRGLHILDSTL